jgi:hypothetical protein
MIKIEDRDAFCDLSSWKISDWLRDQISWKLEVAYSLHIVEEIERLSAERKTACEVANSIPSERWRSVSDRQDRIDIVRAVRVRLGIPSMDQKTEFEEWISKRNQSLRKNCAKITGIAQG